MRDGDEHAPSAAAPQNVANPLIARRTRSGLSNERIVTVAVGEWGL